MNPIVLTRCDAMQQHAMLLDKNLALADLRQVVLHYVSLSKYDKFI